VRATAWLLSLILGATCAANAASSGLAGTSWRLVEIVSMDDSVYTPDERAKYTLDLQADGAAAVLADCNRGSGTWASESAGQLRFGPIAATRASCPPGSLSERYLSQFEWVRSYVMKNGHLYLATMADGSIIEFEPAGNAPATATVLGKEVHAADAATLQDAILTPLFDRYAASNDIKAEPAEIDTFVEYMRRGMAAKGLHADNDLSPDELAEATEMRRNMARAVIRQWKINKSLYDRYGGRIIYQQLGPEPLDAYRAFLEQRQAEGAFTIHDTALADGFWRYFTSESIHDFMAPGSTDEARAFAAPPWEQQP